jgi:hypothetical protein
MERRWFQLGIPAFVTNEYGLFEDVCSFVFNLKAPYEVKIKSVEGKVKQLALTRELISSATNHSASLTENFSISPKQKEQERKASYLSLKMLPDLIGAV